MLVLALGEFWINAWIVVILWAVTLSVVVLALSVALSSAAGWRDQRGLVVLAAGASLFSLGDLHSCIHPVPILLRQIASGISLTASSFMLGGWTIYAARMRRSPLQKIDYALILAAAVPGSLSLIPGLAFGREVELRTLPSSGLVFWDLAPTWVGLTVYGVYGVSALVLVARQLRDCVNQVPYSRYLAVALALAAAAGGHDMLVNSGFINSYYLAELGFVAAVCTLGAGLIRRFIASAAALDGLSRTLETRVAERTEELARTHAALARAERLGAVGRLAAGVAHEINNPASAILANLEFVQRALPKAEQERELGAAMNDAVTSMKRVSEIVRKLLDASRALTETVPSDRVASLAAVAANALDSARKKRPVEVRLHGAIPSDCYVRCDYLVLEQVLANVFDNALQATKQGSPCELKLGVTQNDDRVELEIEDRGVGMSPEVMTRLGEPFFTTRPLGEGAGLGLAVSFGLIRSMGGDLSFESQPGVGTTARLVLAPAPPPLSAPEDGPRAAQKAEHVARTLLLVDDDVVVLRSLSRALAQMYEVSVAGSVQRAKELLSASAFDVVVCDVMMPDGGAPVLFEWLEREHPAQARRTVFLTGGATTDSARAFLAARTQPLLGKPFSLDELREAVARVSASPSVL